MKVLKVSFLVLGMIIAGSFISCRDNFTEGVTSEEQLEIDIELIENYLKEKGYDTYDTLDFDIRALILDEGDGAPIEYEDIVQYNYIGRYDDDVLFDTSIPKLAYEQDTLNAVSYTLERDGSDELVLDSNGLATIESIEYEDGYIPVYSSSRLYEPLVTTHTIGGWYVLQESSNALGFNIGAHFTLDNVKYGGSGLVLLPSYVGGQLFGLGNFVTSFEILPVRKHDRRE